MDSNNIMISVYCITYNHRNYIRQCIEGLVSQKANFNYEIIINDDCSTDGTTEIVKEFENRYPDKIIAVFHEKNQFSQGIALINNLIENAKGKYIAFCEGDDYWIDEYKLQKQVDYLEKNSDYIATAHNVKIVDKNGNENINDFDMNIYCHDYEYKLEHFEKGIMGGHIVTCVCRNIFINHNKEMEYYIKCKSNGDMKTWLYLLLRGKIHCFDEIWAAHRVIREVGGENWKSISYKKNLSLFRMEMYLELHEFAYNIARKDLDFYMIYFYCFYSAVKEVCLKPNKENLKIMVSVFKLHKNKGKLIFDFTIRKPVKKIIKMFRSNSR